MGDNVELFHASHGNLGTPNAVAGVNAFANRLEPIEEARLIPAAGPDHRFLAADPSRIDTIEFALNKSHVIDFALKRVCFSRLWAQGFV